MPIYEYHCKPCDFVFEKLTMSRDQAVSCEQCGGPVDKLMSAASIKTRGEDGRARSTTSSCSSCAASTCSGCH